MQGFKIWWDISIVFRQVMFKFSDSQGSPLKPIRKYNSDYSRFSLELGGTRVKTNGFRMSLGLKIILPEFAESIVLLTY